MKKESQFTIDFIEFGFLVEACIPPRPIARAMFWNSVIDKHYHTMSSEERVHLYQWIKKNWTFEEKLEQGNEDCMVFEARFNPNNQWKVTTKYKGETKVQECFKWKERYHLTISKSLIEDYIIDVVKI